MKIKPISDLHSEGWDFKYSSDGEDVLVLAGDIGVGSKTISFIKSNFPKDLPIVFVPGNHEFYHNDYYELMSVFDREFRNTNIHLLNNSSCIIDGVRFIGGPMHSNFELFGLAQRPFVELDCARGIMDFHCIRNGDNYYKEGNAGWTTQDCKNEFEKFDRYVGFALHQPFNGKTVVVSHFGGHKSLVHPKYANSNITPFFCSDCSHLMGFSDLWISGHTHTSFDHYVEGTRVVCNPRGYGVENSENFNPNLIVEI